MDTAGIRRKGRVSQAADGLAMAAARRAIERADVVVLVLDATEPFAAQDAHIAGYAMEARKPVVVAVNSGISWSDARRQPPPGRRSSAAGFAS